MAQNANVWIVISDTLWQTIKDILTDDEYSGVEEDLLNFLRKQVDWKTTFRMFKTPTIAAEVRYLFNLSFNGAHDDLASIKDAIDELSAIYGIDFSVAGSWWWDGRQGGTQWELDTSGNPTGETTGTPMYPINATQLLKFMPDVPLLDTSGNPELDTSGNPILIPATELADVNLIQGQRPRRFVA